MQQLRIVPFPRFKWNDWGFFSCKMYKIQKWFHIIGMPLYLCQINCKLIFYIASQKNPDLICASACRFVLHIWSRRKLRTRRQMMILWNSIKQSARCRLSMLPQSNIFQPIDIMYIPTMFICMYIKIQNSQRTNKIAIL